ncbi:DUF1682-domain-containing protein [Athelia psychrophila]|uniref:DUF1682-domain-containing protein n=1 Tax=Athelia psychrophila TaxID=1759441 RepID=A0A166FXM8_9AGAM|nr:DUF1682-domain-containing protein [Fibularhizoctonia sp. CBS 109695]
MAGNVLTGILSKLTPPPFVQDPNYAGVEYRYRFLVFRPDVLKQELRPETVLIPLVLVYAAFILWGKAVNAARAKTWFKVHEPLLAAQFSAPSAGGLTADGYSDFFNFSTGRRYVARLHTTFALRPRHDLLQLAFQLLWALQDLAYRPADTLELDFTLGPDAAAAPDCVFAVVAKDQLKTATDDRWDLSFARTSEHAALPAGFSVMSEVADATEQVLERLGLARLLAAHPAALPYLRSLSITDQPRARPARPLPAAKRERHVILALTAPPPQHAAATLPFVAALFALVDGLGQGRVALRPETRVKLRKAREDVDRLIKEEAEKDDREDAAAAKLEAKRKAEDERKSKLSAGEQKKLIEREQKRAMKKSQKKAK